MSRLKELWGVLKARYRTWPRAVQLAATGLLLILALLFFPDGIVGTLKHKGYLPKALDWD